MEENDAWVGNNHQIMNKPPLTQVQCYKQKMAANQEDVKLWETFECPFVCRAGIGLELKGVEYNFVEENLAKSELLKSNPVHKKVPVFIQNEKPKAESLVIVNYIDEPWKNNPILFWAEFIDDKVVGAAWNSVFTADEKEHKKNVEVSLEALQFLENELKEKKFFGLVEEDIRKKTLNSSGEKIITPGIYASWLATFGFCVCLISLMLSKPLLQPQGPHSLCLAIIGMFGFTLFLCAVSVMLVFGARFTQIQIALMLTAFFTLLLA